MESSLKKFLTTAEKSGHTISFVIAGGGIGLFDLFRIEGSSRVLTEARVVYSKTSITRFLGEEASEAFVSQGMSEQLANRLSMVSEADICFALTAALKTDRQRRGKDHGYLSVVRQGKIAFSRHFEISGSTRLEQDQFITDAILHSLQDFLEQNK